MEKLEPLLRYKFWISFAAAVFLPAVGWYLATGSMSVEVDKRWKLVDGKFQNDIPQDGKIALTPNENYIKGLEAINQERVKDLGQAQANLRRTQRQLMVWPDVISETMSYTGYRQVPPDPYAMFKYGNVYHLEIERVRQIVNPYNPETKKGLVHAPEGILPMADKNPWVTIGPPAEQMWDVQEDVWLLTSIMQAIANVNKDATSIVDAPIKAIQEITLKGGSKDAAAANPAGGAAPSADASASARPAVRNTGIQLGTGSVDFDPSDEFGSEVVIPPPQAVAGSEDDGPRKLPRGAASRIRKRVKEDDIGPAAVITYKRYIEGDNTTPYKTRGFKLVVGMDHTFVPELISQLSNMPWPTEVVRLHQSDQFTKNAGPGRAESAGAPANAGNFGTQFADPFGGRQKEDHEAQRAAEKKLLESQQGGTALREGAVETDLLDAALQDQYVGQVVIAGTMTIYMQPPDPPKKPPAVPPKEQPKAADAQTKPPEATQQKPANAAPAGPPKAAPAAGQQKPANPPPASPPKPANAQPSPPAPAAKPPGAQPQSQPKAQGPGDKNQPGASPKQPVAEPKKE